MYDSTPSSDDCKKKHKDVSNVCVSVRHLTVSGNSQHANGDARSKKHSVSDSVHSRTRFSDIVEEDK